jgi:hypothetical protein
MNLAFATNEHSGNERFRMGQLPGATLRYNGRHV